MSTETTHDYSNATGTIDAMMIGSDATDADVQALCDYINDNGGDVQPADMLNSGHVDGLDDSAWFAAIAAAL